MGDDRPPRNLKAMLSESKDTSELMVDLAYAALFFDDEAMATEVHELEERLSDLVHEMREICVLAARSPREAEQMSSVLHLVSAIERLANAAVDVTRVVTHRLGIPPDLYTPIFACSRVAGWIAHLFEQYAGNELIRPRARYTGPQEAHWTPIEKR